MNVIHIKTPKHKFTVKVMHAFIDINKVSVDKKLFTRMCKDGCVNYDKKYSCPPCSPEFGKYLSRHEVKAKLMMVVMLVFEIGQLGNCGYKENLKLKIANSIIKTRIEKIMRALEEKINADYGRTSQTRFIGSGACRLCRPCQRKFKRPCKHPDKMRYSLEALGVDCGKLVKDAFGKELKWYKNKKAPEYTAVVCGMPLPENADKKKVITKLNNILESRC